MRYFCTILLCLMPAFSWADSSFFKREQWDFSGYLKLVFQAPNNQPTAIEMDDLSLFVSAHINRWFNPFIEAELYSIPLWESGQGLQFNQAKFTIERLYNDIQFDEENTLRLGKFLSPVSRWNILHAAPLVWTTNRPIATRYSFANYISGLNIRHEFDLFSGHALEFYWQPYQEFYAKPTTKQDRHYQTVLGAAWILQDDISAYYAFNVQYADVKDRRENRTTLSFDAFLHRDYFDFETQWLVTFVDSNQAQHHAQDWGGYTQFSVPIPLDLHIISRYEHFQFSDKTVANNTLLTGLVYRPYSKLSLKLEWQQTWGSVYKNGTGLYASVAVLF